MKNKLFLVLLIVLLLSSCSKDKPIATKRIVQNNDSIKKYNLALDAAKLIAFSTRFYFSNFLMNEKEQTLDEYQEYLNSKMKCIPKIKFLKSKEIKDNKYFDSTISIYLFSGASIPYKKYWWTDFDNYIIGVDNQIKIYSFINDKISSFNIFIDNIIKKGDSNYKIDKMFIYDMTKLYYYFTTYQYIIAPGTGIVFDSTADEKLYNKFVKLTHDGFHFQGQPDYLNFPISLHFCKEGYIDSEETFEDR